MSRAAINRSARTARADALRHMRGAGIRLTDIRRIGATPWQVQKSLDRVILPGRDGIGIPSAGVVSPRQIHSSLAGGKTSQLAGRNGTSPDPVAPASFSASDHGLDGVAQGWADVVVVDRDLLHADCVPRQKSGRHPVGSGGVTP